MSESDKFKSELSKLITEGNNLLNTVRHYEGRRNHCFQQEISQQARRWIFLSSNALERIVPRGHSFRDKVKEIISHKDIKASGVACHIFESLLALLEALFIEIEAGHLSGWEYNVTAEAFDEFLKYAEHFHKGGKKMESSVIASAVLEDTIKKIAVKRQVSSNGSLEEIIQRLTEENIFTAPKKSRVQSFATVRNKALHAEWDEFEIRDVGKLIEGVRELIDEFLAETI